ncbi:E3 ubiquitin-protein ligase RNF182 isoform X2 [Xenopus laevis]|uniref:E3 ubiquitin-protein ligase RNF182 n=1 Tax=Xenopus laevis TaxID=8355 RepID=A0A8J1LYT4_XENLA|nr:E3 ubiquitin-protein ligase RNF182 isoform X2 [Xenopus laevis]
MLLLLPDVLCYMKLRVFPNTSFAGPSARMSSPDGDSSEPLLGPLELECKICYNGFDAKQHRPKVLGCDHRLCARCLRKMAHTWGPGPPTSLCCPFCRQETLLPEDLQLIPDDSSLISKLSCIEWTRKRGFSVAPEVLLSPGNLCGGPSSSECLVITIMEVSEEPPGLGEDLPVLDILSVKISSSLAWLPGCCAPHQCCPCQPVPRVLLGFLCLVYFSSLPLGVYLLMIQQLPLGIVLVSLVPCTLVLCLLCQCLCHELAASLVD